MFTFAVGNDLNARNRTHKRSVVEDPIDINVEGLCRRIIDTCNVIPGLERVNRFAISLSAPCAGPCHRHSKCSLSGIGSDLKLPARTVVRPGNDLTIIRRIACGVHPGAPSHTARCLQSLRVTNIDIAAAAIEGQCVFVFTGSRPGRALDLPRVPVARVVSRGGAATLVKCVGGEKAGSGLQRQRCSC